MRRLRFVDSSGADALPTVIELVGMIELLCKEADLDPEEFLETYSLYLQTPDEGLN